MACSAFPNGECTITHMTAVATDEHDQDVVVVPVQPGTLVLSACRADSTAQQPAEQGRRRHAGGRRSRRSPRRASSRGSRAPATGPGRGSRRRSACSARTPRRTRAATSREPSIAGHDERFHRADAQVLHEERRGVGAGAEEGRMAERQEARVPEQEVEAQRRDPEDEPVRDLERLEGRQYQREHERAPRGSAAARRPGAPA